MNETKPKKKYVTTGVSWESKALLTKARKRAKEQGRSLSAQINFLLKQDLEANNAN